MEVDEGFQEQPAEVDVVGELVVEAGTAFHMGSMMTELEDLRMEILSMSGKAMTLAGGVLEKGELSNNGERKTSEGTGMYRRDRRRRYKTCGCSCKGDRGPWWIRWMDQRAQCLT